MTRNVPTRSVRVVATCATLLLAASVARGTAQAGPPQLDGPDPWAEDLAALDERARALHADLFHTMTEEEWSRGLARLRERSESALDDEMALEIARLVARVGDGHTELFLGPHDPALGFRRLPVRFYPFDDGIRVQAARDDHARIVGGRLVGIGDAPIEEALARVEDVLARDNEHYLARYAVVQTLNNFDVLRLLGLSSGAEAVEFRVELDDGSAVAARVEPGSEVHGLGKWGLEPLRAALGPGWTFAVPAEVVPWTRRARGGDPFELRHLEDGTLVLDLDGVRDGSDETLAELGARLEEELRRPEVERFVLDLRDNGGGNNQLDRPLLHAVLRNPRIDRPDRLFVLIGGHTFSAASHLVTLFEFHTSATFVGGPTGASPNHYGDAEPTVLPHSGLRVVFSRYYWQNSLPWDRRSATEPDVAVPLTWADYATGRDAALEAARRAAKLSSSDIVLDGELTDGEWGDVRVVSHDDRGEARLVVRGGELHVGVRGAEPGWATVFLAGDDEVLVLHASAALGSARYRRDGDGARLESSFDWTLRRADDEGRAAHYEASRWVATTNDVGVPTEFEFRIDLGGLGEAPPRVAVVYSTGTDPTAHAFPPDLADATADGGLLRGDAPATVSVDAARWLSLE